MTILAMVLPASGLGVVYAQDQGLSASGNYVWQMVGSGQLTGATDPQQFEGYEFVPAKDGFITELCGFFQGTHAVDLYDSSFNILASITISSYEQWNCASINPVAVKKQGQYYAIAEIFSGSEFKQAANLPQTSGDVSIASGVTQPVTAGFGQKLKSDTSFVYGLVDVKFSSDSKDASVLQQAGASLASSTAPAAAPAGQTAPSTNQSQSNGDQNTFKNCASGKCIVCSMSGCQINDDAVSQTQAAPTFIQTCAGGFCYSCTNGSCAKTDAVGIVKTGYSYKNCSQNKCLTCVNGDCITTGGSIPKYTYQLSDAGDGGDGGPVVKPFIDLDHTFADWAAYFGMTTDVAGGDAMSYSAFMGIVSSLNQNSNNASQWSGTSNGHNYDLIIPSLPGQVAVTANAVATATIFSVYNKNATGLSIGANLISMYNQNLAKSMSTAAIGFGTAETSVAQQYYDALSKSHPESNDNSVKTGTTSQAGQSLNLNENAIAVTSLLGVGINANGQVITNANGAPVNMAAVQGIQGVTSVQNTINTALEDVNTKQSDLNGWGQYTIVGFGQKTANVAGTTSPGGYKDVSSQVANPAQVTGLTPGSKYYQPVVDVSTGQVIGSNPVTVTASGTVSAEYVSTLPLLNANLQPMTVNLANTNALQQQMQAEAKTSSASTSTISSIAKSALAGNYEVGTSVALGSPTLSSTDNPLSQNASAPSGSVSTQNINIAQTTVDELEKLGVSKEQANEVNNIVSQYPNSTLVAVPISGSGTSQSTNQPDNNGASIIPTAPSSALQTGSLSSLEPFGGTANNQLVTGAQTTTGTTPIKIGSTSTSDAQLNSGSTATHSAGSDVVVDGKAYLNDAAHPFNPNNIAGDYVDTIATENLQRQQNPNSPGVSSDPNLAACDSVFYGTNQDKSFSDSGSGGGGGGGGSSTTSASSSTTNNTNTTASTQTVGSVTVINGKILTVKDSNNATRTVDITNAVVKLNGNTVSPTSFKFVASDQVKVIGTVSSNSIVPTEIDVTRAEVTAICPVADICIPGAQAVQTTIDYANNGLVCPSGWTCIPEGSVGPIGVPLTQGSLELRFASLTLKDLSTGTSASLISALDKNEPQNPASGNPPQIVDYQPRVSDGKDVTITLQTDGQSTCKYSPYDLPWNFMWNSLDTRDGLTHTSHVGAQADGTYIYYAQCQDKQGLSSKDYMFMYSVDKNYDPRVETDKTPPAVANVSVSSPSLTQGATENVTARIGDNVGVADVLAQIKDPKGQYLAVLGLSDSGQNGTYTYQWDTTSRPAGQYQVTVVANDGSGNFTRMDNAAAFTVANSQASGITIGEQGSGANICKPLFNNGASADKLDVVFVPCGFGSDTASFEMLAQAATDKMFGVTPLSDNKQKFNVTLAEVPGLTCGDTLASNMDNDAIRFREVALPCSPDAVIVLKKGGEDGGISLPGSRIAFMLASDPFLAAHELGHAFFRLNDEYSYGCTAADLSTSFNCDDSPKCAKWKGLKDSKCIAGCTCEGNYRSSDNSVMFDSRTATSFSPAATQHILDTLSAFK